jgi:hypothetical protein
LASGGLQACCRYTENSVIIDRSIYTKGVHMKVRVLMMSIAATALLQGTATAQIYESKDAEGVTEFSDTPTQGAEVVDLPTTNVVAPVEESPMEAQVPAAPAPREASAPAPEYTGGEEGEGGDDNYYGGYGYDDDDLTPREQRRTDADRLENADRVEHHMPAEAAGAEQRAAEPGPAMGEPGPAMRPEGGVHAGGGRR